MLNNVFNFMIVKSVETNIHHEWVCGTETSGTTLIPVLIPIHDFPNAYRGVQRANTQFHI